jgi:hypothetical protein
MTENGGKSRLNKDPEPLHDKPCGAGGSENGGPALHSARSIARHDGRKRPDALRRAMPRDREVKMRYWLAAVGIMLAAPTGGGANDRTA